MTYAPGFDPRFMQALPEGRTWTLVQGDIKAPRLLYRDEAGNEALVPSIWYNQPVAWRVDAMRFYAEGRRENAKRLRDLLGNYEHEAKAADADAVRLDALADDMERTGEVLA